MKPWKKLTPSAGHFSSPIFSWLILKSQNSCLPLPHFLKPLDILWGKENSPCKVQNLAPITVLFWPVAAAHVCSQVPTAQDAGDRQVNQQLQCTMTRALVETSPGPSGGLETGAPDLTWKGWGMAAQSWWQVYLELDPELS